MSEDRRPGRTGTAEGLSGSRTGLERSPTVVPDTDWQGRRDAVLRWLPCATRAALEVFALRHFDRADSAAYLIAEEHLRAGLTARREASHAVSAACDWTAASRRPSYAELQRRRSVMAR